MLKPLIHFDATQFTFFERMLDFTKTTFGNLTAPSFPTINRTPGSGRPLAESLDLLKIRLQDVLKNSPQVLEQLAQFISLPGPQQALSEFEGRSLAQGQAHEAFYHSLNFRYTTAFSLCSYILSTLDYYKKANALSDTNTYHHTMGYFSLLASILAYNACIIHQAHQQPEDVKILTASIRKWLFMLESEDLPHCQNEHFHALLQNFLIKFTKFRKLQLTQESGATLLVGELNSHVQRKNQRAAQFGAPFVGKIIFDSEALTTETLSSSALAKLVENILALQKEAPHRKQFLFYPGYHLGAVEVFDVAWDEASRQFNIINIHSSNNILQYQILKQLSEKLTQVAVQFEIIACQSKVQAFTEDPSCLYAYALSGIVSRLSVEQLKRSSFAILQPPFVDYDNTEGAFKPTLEKVRWVRVSALGPKALIMATPKTAADYQRLVMRLRELYPDKNIAELLRNYCRKYNLALDPKAPTVSYVQSLHKRMQHRRQENPSLSLEAVMAALETTDPGQALRRATLFADTDTFEFLIGAMRDMTLTDGLPAIDSQDSTEQKHFTPLHLALRADKDTRAVKLLVLGGARKDIPDATAQKQTARDVYEKASSNSLLKKNNVLGSLL
ncbi:MAG: hypothetical protein JSR17_00920 [Proteobacteria bacterium]|nr:hypothetical protein [Pseudomonadota bacterium]